MHVVVCVKMVPDTTQVKIDPVTNTLVRKDVPFITNPFDTHAVEEALRVKDKYGARVTAISMGPPAAEAVLRQALERGLHRRLPLHHALRPVLLFSDLPVPKSGVLFDTLQPT